MADNKLLENVHANLAFPSDNTVLIKGNYKYFHYSCDGLDDSGWGCGYRTLQTIMSWLQFNGNKKQNEIPSIHEIQEVVQKVDTDTKIIGTKHWIGSFEICICLDHFFDISSKIHHVRKDEKLFDHIGVLKKHFQEFASPVMMGGDTDNASKCVLGVSEDKLKTYLLILDPHYLSSISNYDEVMKGEWICWRELNYFDENSFYNFCLPQVKSKLLQ